jgi:hypothetical protein
VPVCRHVMSVYFCRVADSGHGLAVCDKLTYDVTLVTAGGKGGKGGKKRKQAAQDSAADAAAPDDADADAGAANGSAETAADKSRLQGRYASPEHMLSAFDTVPRGLVCQADHGCTYAAGSKPATNPFN